VNEIMAFLNARLDEDEAIARAAVSFDYGVSDWCDDGDPVNAHIARHDPARVLRDIAAKREILRRATFGGKLPRIAPTPTLAVEVLDRVVALLAQAYSDHPDYDPAWAVQ
jgi:hypothetical protein